MRGLVIIGGIVVCLPLTPGLATSETTDTITRPDTGRKNDFYVGNREPLLPSPLIKLPIGSIEPKGWLRAQLELEADGFFGHLPELSRFLIKEDNPWLSPAGEGEKFWEEVPYWLKGYGDLAYVLGDEDMIKEARVWINGVIGSQREDGWFGPRANLASPRVHSRGQPDLWPNMPMLNALQSYYEYSGDERVIRLMRKYFDWELGVPDGDFLPPFWQQQRGGDNLASVYWLYNRTGDRTLLELASKIYRNMANWADGVPNWHNVNISQALRGTATYYLQSRDPRHLTAPERNYQTIWGEYGQVPGGMFGGDEDCRLGFVTARQAVETCGMVEMMHSCEAILKIDSDLKWADRCEDVAFNSLPATVTADFRALRYLTSPNLVVSNSKNKHPRISNKGPKFQMNPHAHRCCQLNMGQGWPYYAEHLWMATPDNGLALIFYSDSKVTAKVGDGIEVTITQSTHYPFDGTIELSVSSSQAVEFPLYLRMPKWCDEAELTMNGRKVEAETKPQTFLRIDRKWVDGDVVKLKLPMQISVRTWTNNANSVSVDRGPLSFSLKIAEKYVPIAGSAATSKENLPDSWRRALTEEQLKAWPAFDIYPASPWNYGLVLDKEELEDSFDVTMKTWPSDNQVWHHAKTPIEIKAKGRKIPDWQLDETDLAGLLSQSPVRSKELVEEITLIPMGAARLRLSAFPVIDNGPDGHEWATPPEPPLIKRGPAGKAPATTKDFNVLSYGAVADGRSLCTAAIQTAIDRCSKTGGRVVFPAGTYITGTFYIKSGVELHLEKDAVILGSADINDYATDTGGIRYDTPWMDRCLIYAEDADNISITGEGTLYGNGSQENFPPGRGNHDRPMLLRFFNCDNIALRDFKMRSPASWGSAIIGCDNIEVSNLNIHNRSNWNGDGLDFDSCRNVTVDNCDINTSDDSICLQASEKDRPCENIKITNCRFSSHWAAIRIGLLTRSNIRNVEMRDCHFHDIVGEGFKLQMAEGAVMENMLFENVTMENVTRPLFMTLNSHRFCRSLKDVPLPPPGRLRNVKFRNIKAIAGNPEVEDAKAYMAIIGLPEQKIEDIEFENVEITFPGGGTEETARRRDVPELGDWKPEFFSFNGDLPAYGVYIRHASGITLNNVKLRFDKEEKRPPIICDDVEGFSTAELEAQCSDGVEPVVSF